MPERQTRPRSDACVSRIGSSALPRGWFWSLRGYRTELSARKRLCVVAAKNGVNRPFVSKHRSFDEYPRNNRTTTQPSRRFSVPIPQEKSSAPSCTRSSAWLHAPSRVISSVGRALRLHRRCREFESLITHHSHPPTHQDPMPQHVIERYLAFCVRREWNNTKSPRQEISTICCEASIQLACHQLGQSQVGAPGDHGVAHGIQPDLATTASETSHFPATVPQNWNQAAGA